MGKGSAKFDSKKFQQKLQSLVNERDSIYDLSSIFFQNKDYAHQLVKFWTDAFEAGNVDYRLALVYLANEILHNCKRKDATVYKEEWKQVLPHCLSLLKGTNVVDKVLRVLELWSERKLLDASFCANLIAGISSSSGSIEDARIDSELIKNFTPDTVINALKEFLILETDAASKERQLSLLPPADAATIRRLKDRSHAEAYRQQLEESCLRLEELVRDLERLEDRREALLEQLDKAHMFFAAQYSDVSVVVTAYRKYGEMVAFMRRRADDRLAEFVAAEAVPAPSPTADTADAFGAEVALLSRREDEMDVESVGSGGDSQPHHQRQGKQRQQQEPLQPRDEESRHRRQQQQQQHHRRHGSNDRRGRRRRSSRPSRSRSRSGSPAVGNSNSSRRRHHQHQQQQHHEMAVGSDSPPPPQSQHRRPRRGATPTLDERIGAVAAAAASTTAVPASPATSAASSPVDAVAPPQPQPQQPPAIGSWLLPNWRPPQHPQALHQHHQQQQQQQQQPPRPPPLPPPPPFFPPFVTAPTAAAPAAPVSSFAAAQPATSSLGLMEQLQPQLRQQQPQPPAAFGLFPGLGGGGGGGGRSGLGDSDERLLMPQQLQQQQQQQAVRPLLGVPVSRWRPV